MRSFTPLKRRHKALATLPDRSGIGGNLYHRNADAVCRTGAAREVVVTARARAESLQDVPPL